MQEQHFKPQWVKFLQGEREGLLVKGGRCNPQFRYKIRENNSAKADGIPPFHTPKINMQDSIWNFPYQKNKTLQTAHWSFSETINTYSVKIWLYMYTRVESQNNLIISSSFCDTQLIWHPSTRIKLCTRILPVFCGHTFVKSESHGRSGHGATRAAWCHSDQGRQGSLHSFVAV